MRLNKITCTIAGLSREGFAIEKEKLFKGWKAPWA